MYGISCTLCTASQIRASGISPKGSMLKRMVPSNTVGSCHGQCLTGQGSTEKIDFRPKTQLVCLEMPAKMALFVLLVSF